MPLSYGNISVDTVGDVLFAQGTTPEMDLALVELRVER